MPRTIIDIPEAQLREVDRLCEALKISRAEAVRRGLTAFIRQYRAVRADRFGLWRGAGGASHERLRRLWDLA